MTMSARGKDRRQAGLSFPPKGSPFRSEETALSGTPVLYGATGGACVAGAG